MVSPSVMRLLASGGPAAIAGLIVPVIIYSVYGQIFWPVAHIGVEVNKTVPPFAYFYATTAIVFIVFVFRIFAASYHAIPNIVFGAFAFPMRSVSFFHDAAATTSPARLDMRFSCYNSFPTVTHQFPHGLPRLITNASDSCQLPKFFPRNEFGNLQATTSFGAARSEIRALYNREISANADALPISTLATFIRRTFNNSKSVERFANQIKYGCHTVYITSKWANQVGNRAQRLAQMMRNG